MGSQDRRYLNVLKSNQNQLTQSVSVSNLSAYVCVYILEWLLTRYCCGKRLFYLIVS